MKALVLVLILVLLLGSFIYTSRVMPEVPASEQRASIQFREKLFNIIQKYKPSITGSSSQAGGCD